MKKILSVALSTAMAFSMFASVAFGADAKLTPEQQFNALKEAGIVTGFPDGLSHLEKTLTRAELAKIIVNAIDLEPVTGVATYKDKNYSASHWAAPYIEAATAAGILQGKDTVKGLFDPTGNVTVQELAKVLVTALKLEVPADANNTASAWAKGYVAAAVKAGYIADGINYQAAATRSQAVVAAHAIYEANQVPTVKSYKVVDPKNVEVTMSNGEVVKVALEKALEANKETEIKFTYQDREYTTKVTYETTVAQAVKSVTADNLKEVVITFDGTVDAETAGDEDNYVVTDKTIDSATVSEDKTSVTLRLVEADTLKNKKETEVEIKNVKNEDGTKTIAQKVDFTPVDVTAPTIKQVTSLGTKAFKIEFSEPIQKGAAVVSSNYKVDGKGIGASIVYSYSSNSVIVQTKLTEGEHTVSVSNVMDFSTLKIAPVENDFTVVADTTAPEIASIESDDLNKVVVTFNETIKDVDSAYANVSSRDAEISIEDNKVTLTFEDEEGLNYGENTIVLKGVRDYSDNTADREGKVTPTLDTTRPTLASQELKFEDGEYKLTLKFSEDLDVNEAQKRDNYTLKNADGKVIDDVDGVNADGHPIVQPTYSNKKVEIVIAGLDEDKEYILSVKDLKDDASVGNVVIPFDVKFNTGEEQQNGVERAWIDDLSGDEAYVYVEFKDAVSTSGDGNALDPEKYSTEAGTLLTEDEDDVELINSETIRITTTNTILTTTNPAYDSDASGTPGYRLFDNIRISYVKDANGDYIKNSGSYSFLAALKADGEAVSVVKAEATNNDTVKIEFDGKIGSVSKSDFELSTGQVPSKAQLSSDGKTVTLTFASDVLPDDPTAVDIETVNDLQDEYGNDISVDQRLVDKIRPALTFTNLATSAPATPAETATGATYFNLTFTTSEAVVVDGSVNDAFVRDLFSVKLDTQKAELNGITFSTAAGVTTITLRVYTEDAVVLNPNTLVTVKFDGSKNDTADALVDANDNAVDGLSKTVKYSEVD